MQQLRVLSITRPWTTLILNHGKDIENRTWTTTYRGPLIVHAAKSWQGSAVEIAHQYGIEIPWDRDAYPTGIVGVVDVVNVCSRRDPYASCCGRWAAHGQAHWHLANPRALAEPLPCNGALQLWEPDQTILNAVQPLLATVTPNGEPTR